ncbi:MAG: flippase-like domain-containing protein [Chloroflexi bacterium]|nr:flippase-like domain-containing protein [Chloroflexota bacterium]
MQSRKSTFKRWLRLALQLLSLALFGLILWSGGWEIWQQILAGDRWALLAAFLWTGLANALSATRLQLVARSLAGQELAPWRRFYYLTMTACALGLVVPRSLSTLGGKSVGLRALGVSLKRSFWTVLLDNLFDLVLLGVLIVPSLLFLEGWVSSGTFTALTLGSILMLAGALWWVTTAGRLLPLVRWLKRIPRLESALRIDHAGIIDLLPTRPTALRALGLSALLNGALATRFYYIARAVGVAHPWLIFIAGFPMTQLSLVLAVTPGGLGLFDAGWYGVLLLGGMPHQEALTFVIAQRAYIFVFVLIWAGFSTLLSLTLERQICAADVRPVGPVQGGKER